MANSVDIDIFPIYRRAGQDLATIPGLFVPKKPRRTARSREADQLIIFITLAGNATMPLEYQDQIVSELVKTYYDTNGSVTAALRVTVEALNQLLLKRNLQGSSSIQQIIGMLSLATLRGDQFYLAQSGQVYAQYLSAREREELYDPALTGRGLGLNQSAPVRYFHASLQPGDLMVMTGQPPTAWSAEQFAMLYGRPLEFQQRLLLEGVSDAIVVLLTAKAGAGQILLLPGKPVAASPASTEISPTVTPLPAAGLAVAPLIPGPEDEFDDETLRRQIMLDQYQPLPDLDVLPANGSPLASEALSVSPPPSASGVQPATGPAPLPGPSATKKPGRTSPGLVRRLGIALRTGLNRLLPEDALAAIPNTVMAFIAIAVPLVIVAMAMAVYFQRGLAAQAEAAYSQAVDAIAQAQTQTEPANRREGFNTALSYLEAGDSYRRTPQAQALRLQILVELDGLDLVRRLNYQPAIIGGLPGATNISRIVTANTDLYMLDSGSGRVIRAFYTNQGYQVDPAFQCGPGAPANLGPLVDISAWPAGASPKADIVGMDAAGVLLFCSPDSAPLPKRLANPPGMSQLSGLKVFALDQTDVYVLDAVSNALWAYYTADFEGEPASYFAAGEAVPALQDVIDMAVTNEELYLLHSDGRMTICVTAALSEVTPNRCTDPAPYVDTRIGREGQPLSPAPVYSQVQYSPPPDPSLYLVDPDNQAVDRYSLRNLAYQVRYLPEQSLPQEATAGWVDPLDRLIFLGLGNRIYYSTLP